MIIDNIILSAWEITVFAGIIGVRITIILTRIVHLRCCLIMIEKKSRRGTIMTVGVAAAAATAAAAAAIIDDRKAAEKETGSRDHRSHGNTVLLLC